MPIYFFIFKSRASLIILKLQIKQREKKILHKILQTPFKKYNVVKNTNKRSMFHGYSFTDMKNRYIDSFSLKYL